VIDEARRVEADDARSLEETASEQREEMSGG
jgi:hypothetical protein